MLSGIVEIIKAVKCALDEKNRQSRQFKQKQNEIYLEGLTEAKLYEQLMRELDSMYADPRIKSKQVRIDPAGLPFMGDILPRLHCEVIRCADPTQLILIKDDTYV